MTTKLKYNYDMLENQCEYILITDRSNFSSLTISLLLRTRRMPILVNPVSTKGASVS